METLEDNQVALRYAHPYLWRCVDTAPGQWYVTAAPRSMIGSPGVWRDTEGRAVVIVAGDRAAVLSNAGGTFDIRKVQIHADPTEDSRGPAMWRLWIQAEGRADAWELPMVSTAKLATGWIVTEHAATVTLRGRRWSCRVIEHSVGSSIRWSVRVHHGDVTDSPDLTNTVSDAIVYIQCSRPIAAPNSGTGRDGMWHQVLVAHCQHEGMPLHRCATVTAWGGTYDTDHGMVFGLVFDDELPLRAYPAPRIIAELPQQPIPAHVQQTKRELAQAPWSGTTGDGDQPGFGAATCGALWTPRANPRELRLWLEAARYALVRPTLHTRNGYPLMVAPPDLRVLDLKPNWNSANQLGGGQDPRGDWTRLPTPSDDEHRDDAALCIMAMATRDELLLERIDMHAVLQSASLWIDNEWLPTARGLGRMLLALAYADRAGCRLAKHLIERLVGIAWRDFVPGYPIAPRDTAKYGWHWPNGDPVRGWQPWQQSILAIGLAAAANCAATELLKSQCLTMAMSCAAIVVRLGWRRETDAAPFRHVYAIADDIDEPAEQRLVPRTLDGNFNWPTVDIPDCERWSLAAAMLYCRQPDNLIERLVGIAWRDFVPGYPSIGARAQQILAQYPPRSGTSDGQWLAVQPFAPLAEVPQ